MYAMQPKKLLIINILDILRRYTDENHRLSQREITTILENEYQMRTERKAVKRNLMNLIDFGYKLEYAQSVRINKDGEEELLLTDWYLVRDFSDAELRLLMDSLLFSKHIPYRQCRELIKKIEGLSSRYFVSGRKHVHNLPENMPENKQLFYNIEILGEAIEKHRQVAFVYNDFGTDKRMHPRLDQSGEVREYMVNPYQMAATNGRYYLICNYDKYADVANYRVDRITEIRMLETAVKPMHEVKGLEKGLDLPRHMAEHIYMFTGESGHVLFRAKAYLVTELIDWFGADIRFLEQTEDEVTASVWVNLKAMQKWALQYALHARILSPRRLADAVSEDIKKAMENYKG